MRGKVARAIRRHAESLSVGRPNEETKTIARRLRKNYVRRRR